MLVNAISRVLCRMNTHRWYASKGTNGITSAKKVTPDEPFRYQRKKSSYLLLLLQEPSSIHRARTEKQ